MTFETTEAEKKVVSILKILGNCREPIGARLIAHQLKNHGIELGERAVRYHLKITDERGLTKLVGRDGRLLTEKGQEEIQSARVKDKVGFAISKIELLSFRTSFDIKNRTGMVPVNVSFFPKSRFDDVIQIMRPIFKAGLSASNLIALANEGETIGEFLVPKGKVAIATVCSIIINGSLLKAGIPMDSRFGGILQYKDYNPFRFVELIHYTGSSLDPSEVFIRAHMTAVKSTVKTGDGKILANFREIPAICRDLAEQVLEGLHKADMGGVLSMGNTSDSICEVPVEQNKIGMILIGGLNPIAAVEESGIEAENHAMSTVVDYKKLINIKEV